MKYALASNPLDRDVKIGDVLLLKEDFDRIKAGRLMLLTGTIQNSVCLRYSFITDSEEAFTLIEQEVKAAKFDLIGNGLDLDEIEPFINSYGMSHYLEPHPEEVEVKRVAGVDLSEGDTFGGDITIDEIASVLIDYAFYMGATRLKEYLSGDATLCLSAGCDGGVSDIKNQDDYENSIRMSGAAGRFVLCEKCGTGWFEDVIIADPAVIDDEGDERYYNDWTPKEIKAYNSRETPLDTSESSNVWIAEYPDNWIDMHRQKWGIK